MKGSLAIAIVALTALLTPGVSTGQQDQGSSGAPPSVQQTLVPEGYFATKLVAALKLGTPEDDAQAESLLAAVDIAPKNGWIATYPVTPDIVGEVKRAVAAAADAGALAMGRDEAVAAFENVVSAEMGVAITDQPSDEYGPQGVDTVEPSALSDYYGTEGPPVVTYYPPPPDYSYLYEQVDSPFWCDGYFFPGFFVLSDFDVIVVEDGHHHRHDRDDDRGRGGDDRHHHGNRFEVTNHVFDPRSQTVTVIDPDRRGMAEVHATEGFRRPVHTIPFVGGGERSVEAGQAMEHRTAVWNGSGAKTHEFRRALPVPRPPESARVGGGEERRFTVPEAPERHFGASLAPAPESRRPPGAYFLGKEPERAVVGSGRSFEPGAIRASAPTERARHFDAAPRGEERGFAAPAEAGNSFRGRGGSCRGRC